jgi:uncharacterized damage-inducible protein DinB
VSDALPSPKRHFVDAMERESVRTLRVIRAYPDDKSDLKPHPKSPSAREIAWKLTQGQGLMVKALTTGFDWSNPTGAPPPPPARVSEIAEAFEKGNQKVMDTVRGFDESRLTETVQFFVGPKTLGDYTKLDFLWFLLLDQVHHRGQLSTYLRMAEGHVPSIYGPSGDEPWR